MSQLDSMSQEVPATGMEKFLEENFRKLVWLFIIAVVAIIAYGLIRHQNTLKANEAAEAHQAHEHDTRRLGVAKVGRVGRQVHQRYEHADRRQEKRPVQDPEHFRAQRLAEREA